MASEGGGGDKGGGKTLNIKKEIALNSHLNTVVLYCKRGWYRGGRGTEGQYHDNGEERIRLLQLPYFFLGRTPLPPSPAKNNNNNNPDMFQILTLYLKHTQRNRAGRRKTNKQKTAKMHTHAKTITTTTTGTRQNMQFFTSFGGKGEGVCV